MKPLQVGLTVLASLAVVAAVLFGVEAWLGQWETRPLVMPHHRAAWITEHAPNIDITGRPSPAAIERSQGLVDRTVRFRTDANGFIEPSADPDATDIVIAFLGGSSTENFWVAEPLRFAAGSARLLSERTGRSVGAWNGGFRGNHLMHSVTKLLYKVGPMRPDVVVVMHGVNDAAMLENWGSYIGADERDTVVQRTPETGLARLKALVARDLFPNTLYRLHGDPLERLREPDKVEQLRARFARSWFRRSLASGVSESDALDQIEAVFRETLVLFIGIARYHGIVPVLMTQPNRFLDQPDPFISSFFRQLGNLDYLETLTLVHDRLQDVIRDVAVREGIVLVDLENKIPGERAYIHDRVHMTDLGASRVAEEIAAALAPVVSALPSREERLSR